MRSESTVAFGHPSETKPTFGCAGLTMEAALAALIGSDNKNGTERSARRRAQISQSFSGRSFLVLLESVRLGRRVIVFAGTSWVCSEWKVTENRACLLL